MSKHTKERVEAYLASCPDKSENKATISRQFKKDLAQYLMERDCKDQFLELGTSYGHTTQLLSIVCDRVVTVDNVLSHTTTVMGWGLKNVKALVADLYEDIPTIINKLDEHGPYTASLIDAVHTYVHSLSDAKLSILLGCNSLIFDDTGLFDGVNLAYQKVVEVAQNLNIQTSRRPMGKLPGSFAHGDKIFKRSEGEVIEFPNITDEQRRELIIELNKEEPMSQNLCICIDKRIQEIVSEKMDDLKIWINNMGNTQIIELHSQRDNQLATEECFTNTINRELHEKLGRSYDCLPEESYSDIMSILHEIDEEHEVCPNPYLKTVQ